MAGPAVEGGLRHAEHADDVAVGAALALVLDREVDHLLRELLPCQAHPLHTPTAVQLRDSHAASQIREVAPCQPGSATSPVSSLVIGER